MYELLYLEATMFSSYSSWKARTATSEDVEKISFFISEIIRVLDSRGVARLAKVFGLSCLSSFHRDISSDFDYHSISEESSNI